MNEGTHDENEDGSGDGAGRVEERRTLATQPKRAMDMMWKTGKTWVEEEKEQNKKVLVQ